MSRATVEAVNGLPEHHRVLRFVVPALGFPSGEVHYRREVRAAGSSKYPLARMIRLSVDSLTGFSTAPLRLATWFGLGGGLAAFGLLVYALRRPAQRAHGRRLDLDRRGGGGRRRRAAAVPRACSASTSAGCTRMMQGRPSYFVAYDSLQVSPDDERSRGA